MVERVLGDYVGAYGLVCIALRYSNACGADAEGDLGKLRLPETHLIPRAMMAPLRMPSNAYRAENEQPATFI